MTLSSKDSAECFAAAERVGLFLMEALWTAYFPAMQKVMKLVPDSCIGTPRYLEARFVSYRDPARHPNLFDPKLGGGARNDLGIYPVAAALLGVGPVASISATHVMGPTGVDEMTTFTLKHENGVLSQLVCGFRANLPIAMRLAGSHGRIEVPDNFHQPRRVILHNASEQEIFDLPPLGNGYAHEAIAFQQAIHEQSRDPLIWSEDLTWCSARILEASGAETL